MANQEQLDILRQGTKGWNQFRLENKELKIDLSEANLMDADLKDADLMNANLRLANLMGANLSGANLRRAHLIGANLWEARLRNTHFARATLTGSRLNFADLTQADLLKSSLWNADLTKAILCDAILNGADLNGANLWEADLAGANLGEANLWGANLSEVNIKGTNLAGVSIGETNFSGITHLDKAIGLEDITHISLSFVDNYTLQASEGRLPDVFLRGCGYMDWEIESTKLYKPDLQNEEIIKIQYRMYDLRATRAVQISPLFISYSHTDRPFVDRLDKTLVEKGIRFWRDIHDMTSGRMEAQIDRAIRQNPTVLLVLSKNSLNSDWVQHEVRKARELEKELGRDALCPVALDDSWKSASWPTRIMEQIMEYNILDFSGWEDQTAFQSKFSKLLSGLDLFYKKSES